MKRLALVLFLLVPALPGQGTASDYQRALAIGNRLQIRATNVAGPINWIGETDRFWYRKTVKGGFEFVAVDTKALVKRPAFDHARLAATLSTAAGGSYTATTLPFVSITFSDGGRALLFSAAGSTWRCDLVDYSCRKTGTAPPEMTPGRGAGPEDESPAEFENDVVDGMASPQVGQRQQGQTQGGFGPFQPPPPPAGRWSPDLKSEAVIVNYNVHLRPKGETSSTPLSSDGSEGNYYTINSIAWSPDSRRLAAYRVRPGHRREVHFIESSPRDQLQPKHSSRLYAKPGDTLDVARPVLFDTETRRAVEIDNALFPNPYSLSQPVWWKDGRGFTFEYNQRGHQLYRVVEVGVDGTARALITEESRTFINYRPLLANPRDSGKKVRHHIDDGREIIWMSERDGWAHLYMYDGVTGRVKHQITKGAWVVRSVDYVDEKARQIWFQASGMHTGKDPYFTHYFRINFDGTGMVALTEADGNHTLSFSHDRKHYVDTWSRVDQAPVAELRSTDDQKKLIELERGDMQPLADEGWRPPEVFTAMGRDGKTDIWGVIYRPRNFDASKKYPVIERIYAGPQGSFVPKTFSETADQLAELGFIVVQIDGMGTNNRSKAFHDVAWRNLGDAGFPDRILWHRAVAAKYPYYDITRVGLYGNSAGGQNTLGGLLFHPEFYKVGVSNSGCHDNRMDKIWWNEQWMGWPLGPHYVASSNVENAHKLKGKLLLIVGELDTNVDPASTLQVVNALIRANKKHDLLFVPGGGHGAGGTFGRRLLWDFFVHHLHGVEPPEWN